MTVALATLSIVAGGTALAVITWVVRIARRMHGRITDFLDDWAGSPARRGVAARPGVMERLQTVEKITTETRAETKPNGGDSMRDAVHRIELDVSSLSRRVELFEHQREERDEP